MLTTRNLLYLFTGSFALGLLSGYLRYRRRIDFRGRSVLISGGSRGLGLELARQLAAQGAQITLLGRDEASLQRAGQELHQIGAPVLLQRCDIRARQNARDAVQRVFDRFGRVDVLFNVAGTIQVGPVEHMHQDDFENQMDTHFRGPLYLIDAVLPHMKRRRFGRIVNITSILGAAPAPHLVPYSASKAAEIALSDGLRAELARYGISVTTVCPGLMRTGSHPNALFKGHHQKEYVWFASAYGLPFVSVSARHAARRIIEACRYARPMLVISAEAHLARWLYALMPNTYARLTQLAAYLLPRPGRTLGEQRRTGWESQSGWAPNRLTRTADMAIPSHNQTPADAPAPSEKTPG